MKNNTPKRKRILEEKGFTAVWFSVRGFNAKYEGQWVSGTLLKDGSVEVHEVYENGKWVFKEFTV